MARSSLCSITGTWTAPGSHCRGRICRRDCASTDEACCGRRRGFWFERVGAYRQKIAAPDCGHHVALQIPLDARLLGVGLRSCSAWSWLWGDVRQARSGTLGRRLGTHGPSRDMSGRRRWNSARGCFLCWLRVRTAPRSLGTAQLPSTDPSTCEAAKPGIRGCPPSRWASGAEHAVASNSSNVTVVAWAKPSPTGFTSDGEAPDGGRVVERAPRASSLACQAHRFPVTACT